VAILHAFAVTGPDRLYGRSSDIDSFAGQLADATLGLLPDLAALGGEAA
jgi:hypothetical protein